jgi:DNA/RNA endonuclease YhcR with UshA esterase domain
MKRIHLIQTAVAAAAICAAGATLSHHSPATVYVLNQEIEIEGTVTDYRYNNPHVRIFIDVENENGETESWVAEGGTPNILLRHGWGPETFAVGDPIQVRGHPARVRESNFIHMEYATLSDGRELYGEDVQSFTAEERRRSRSREE